MKALKCRTLGAELSHALYIIFTLMTVYPLLRLVGNGLQLNLPRGNFNDCKSEEVRWGQQGQLKLVVTKLQND